MSLTRPAAHGLDAHTGEWSLTTQATELAAIFLHVLVVGAYCTLAGSLLPTGRIEAER
jgi:hypothetical protein